MLVLKTKSTRSQDGLQVFIEFFNATGNYDSVNNPGGWGSPNPARNTLAMLFYGNFKRVTADVPAVPTAFDPTTVQSYTLNISGVNGVIDFYIFAVPLYNSGGTYHSGDITYDNTTNPSNPVLQQYNGTTWLPIDITVLIGVSTIVQVEGFLFPVPEMEAYRNALYIQRVDQVRQNILDNDDDWEAYHLARKNFDYVDGTLDASGMEFCSQNYAVAQARLEELERFAAQNPVS